MFFLFQFFQNFQLSLVKFSVVVSINYPLDYGMKKNAARANVYVLLWKSRNFYLLVKVGKKEN